MLSLECLSNMSKSRHQTFKKLALTSETFFASFVSRIVLPAGTFQSFTFHHHLRIRAPKLCPLNLADLFQCRQPLSMSVHSTPWAKQKMTCAQSISTWVPNLVFCSHLVLQRDPQHALP